MEPDEQDFAADFKEHVNEFVIHEYEKNMPFRLIDTYTGLILERSKVTSLLKERGDYDEKLGAALSEASHPPDPESPLLSPNLDHLKAFMKEYLAFATFSHRWRGREITIKDVRNTCGIYSIVHPPLQEERADEFRASATKLQEFCCAAAKCGFRWAWADTCCIDEEVFGEKSESLNSMFLWYRTSDLTIVYLDDVEDVEEEYRLPPVDGDQWLDDEQIQNPFTPSYPSSLKTEDIVTLHNCHQDDPLRLQSMQPDTQVETEVLRQHLEYRFPSDDDRKARPRHTKLPEWVTRGWTLQEALAPKYLRFYSKRWTLLEEVYDRETEDDEKKISISSFKCRARLVDHRTRDMWRRALENTAGIPEKDLCKFEPGAKDVRSRLGWAARRRTTKDEDMAYCLLGIFDVTLPVFYGEGHRAFFRLQEEIIKRTGDVSLFDWCGRSSLVNSFLAYTPQCFLASESDSLSHGLDSLFDPSDSTVKKILKVLRLIFGITGSGIKAVARSATKWVDDIMQSLPPGHTLVNGGLNIPLFEHEVKSCRTEGNSSWGHSPQRYTLEADGLKPTEVTLAPHAPALKDKPKRYYLCRAWNWDTQNIFNILLDLVKRIFRALRSLLPGQSNDDESESSDDEGELKEDEGELSNDNGESGCPSSQDNEGEPNSKMGQEVDRMLTEVWTFFRGGFTVYLIRVKDGRRVRINTLERVVSGYSEKLDFTTRVETRKVL